VKRFRILNLVLIGLIGLATWRTIEVWRRVPPEVAEQGENPSQPLDTGGAPAKRPALPQLVTNITEKDLFDVSRQAPSVASGPVPEQTPAPPPTLKLAGVIFVGSQHEAVFVDVSQNNKQIRMREGEEIGGYKVAKISTQQVSLVSGTGDEVKLDLLLETGKGPGPKPAGPGGVAPLPPGQTAATPPGGFGPPGGAAAMQRNDARDRAQRARERLKRLREEASANR
jgi:hypothetical protein